MKTQATPGASINRVILFLSALLILIAGCGQPMNGGTTDTTSATSVTNSTTTTSDTTGTAAVIEPTTDGTQPTTLTTDGTQPTSVTGGTSVPDATLTTNTDGTQPTTMTTDGTQPTVGTLGDTGYVIANDARFSTLATAVTSAGLLDTFHGAGPYTVFAPTNEAFAALPAGDLQLLLGDQTALTQLLQYHVSPGLLRSGDLDALGSVTTLNGKNVQVTMDGNDVVLDGKAKLVTKDIETTNGIIHQIDVVLIPST